ncbi:MAG: class I SAM-dependent RNA methyltransferase [Tabrizicola sp.]|uniref:class I SAM-dependent RNA methyltransferase n=1 Tax=Tabrizicola sp. TaxID=2005166 RepID=UPI002ABA40B7|nr:class I SAM-dependent RNA methyltransferase [Tabrizicola sp.]MDZ4087719.1 class I SAM-dependent RNA methyltransferase [Tabrizicola sp.]
MIVTIDRLGHLGHGIARDQDSGPIYVPGTLPGEVVEGTLDGDRLIDPKIVTPSPDRVKPPCRHARACGGCQLQHASDAFVAQWKQHVIETALAGQGLTAEFLPLVTSPPNSRRRATLSARRTKSGVLIGFHARASDTIAEIPDCQLLHPGILAAFPGLQALVMAGGSRTTELSLQVTLTRGGPDVVVSGGKALDSALRMDLARLVETHAFSRLTWDGETVALRDRPALTMGQATVVPPPGAFLQATQEGEAALLHAVKHALGPQKRIVDLFSGVGTFTLPLAEKMEVHAVEGDPAMTKALDLAARNTPNLHRISTETRDLFRRPLEPDELLTFTGAVIDPPRAGAEAQTQTLATSKIPVIAAVSCNPVTFARDAKTLIAQGYRLDWVQVVDQFRWSTHIELVARLSRP